MEKDTDSLKAGVLPAPESGDLPPEARAELVALARRRLRAEGPVIRALNAMGGDLERRVDGLPPSVRRLLATGTAGLLEQVYRAAGRVGSLPALPETGEWGHRAAALVGGAVGGAGGLATAVVELPATVALYLHAMQKVAAEYGFDPRDAEVRLDCIAIFGAGGPGSGDDGVNSGFLGSRLAVNGATLRAVAARAAPILAAVLGRKLAAQVVPVLGGAAGAGINLAYLAYYRDLAHVRFGLKRLAARHGAAAVAQAFDAECARLAAPAGRP
ncbi:EcsC family protein [Albidovulum sp.]